MAKAKGKKGSGGGANSHLRARLGYLFHAATYLQSAPIKPLSHKVDLTNGGKLETSVPQIDCDVTPGKGLTRGTCAPSTAGHLTQLSRVFISQMRGVSLKSQLRLPIEQKRSFCKRCDTPLFPGSNCIQEIKNTSRDSKKPWADVRIFRCATCGTEKRFPQTEKRSRKLLERRKNAKKAEHEEKSTGN